MQKSLVRRLAHSWQNTFILLLSALLGLNGCHFHLQGDYALAPEMHQLYLQTNDPYGVLTRSLQQYFKMSHVNLVKTPEMANVHLNILSDTTSQDLISVSGTQQTRQYKMQVAVTIELIDNKGQTILVPQTFIESRIITVQSNQTLGSSNEANLAFQQMRQSLAHAIINRLASHEVSRKLAELKHENKLR